MKAKTWVTVAVVGTLMLATLAVLALGSRRGGEDAGGQAQPAPTTTVEPIIAPAPDPSTPEGVAVLALQQIYSWQPASELPGVSLLRARKWLGPNLRGVLDKPALGIETPKPSLQWSDWAASRAIIEAFAFASGERAPATPTATTTTTAQVALRQVLCKIGIAQTAVYPDGRREQLPPTTVIATMVLTPDGWLLDGYR